MVCLAWLGACSNKPVEIRQTAVQDLRIAKAKRSPCAFQVTFVDQRSSKENLGNVGYRGFVFNDFAGWFERQVRTRLRSEEASDTSPMVQVELIQAYLEQNRATLSFNVVVKATNASKSVQVFRGDNTKMNWLGGDSEFGAYIERASQVVLDKLQAAQVCNH
jgi:hypothetical protein